MGATESKRKQKEKLKKDPAAYEAYLERERKYDQKRRKIKKKSCNSNFQKASLNRKRERDRKCANQLKKKHPYIDTTASELGSYNCKQTLGKAVKKIKLNLPISPRKRIAVAKRVLFDVFSPEEREQVIQEHIQKRNTAISEADRNDVTNFYLSDEHSWQSPNRRDTKSVTDLIT